MKSFDELKELHGNDYVDKFVHEQLPFRLERLIDLFSIDKNSSNSR